MAIFDPAEQRLCVRVVYDGVGGAGKTTNLKALSGLFATQRTKELVSPGEVDGRTLFFDWLQILAGAICGFPLMCQIISVPGQTVLTPRRRHLLATADVIVYVGDSDPAGIERARRGYELLTEVNASRRVPVVLQANKQDHAQALAGAAVAEALGHAGHVVEAIATDGIGVVDTFVAAVRAVSKVMTTQIETGTLEVEVGAAPAAEDVLQRLEAQTLDPEWAAEMFLEEASAAFLIEGGFERKPRAPAPERVSAPSFPRPNVEVGFVWPAHTGRQVLQALATEFEPPDPVPIDREGRCEIVVGGHRLQTTRELRFDDREEARQALVRAARERARIEQAAETVLVLQAAQDDAFWLWTVVAA